MKQFKLIVLGGGAEGIKFIQGNAKFLSNTEIQVNEKIYKANKFVVATGSSTFIPLIEGIDRVDYLTNIEALHLKELPHSMIILGSGPLGIEFAQMFSRFGTKVYLLQKRERIIPRVEPELAALLQRYLEDEGIEIWTKAEIKSIRGESREKRVKTVVDGKEKTFKGEKLLIATGRRPHCSEEI